jgi:Carbohydrate family 9 binding domain-like
MENLYVGYDCEDTDIVALFTERDDPSYRDDAVEIFINAKPEQTGAYFGLEMNAHGVQGVRLASFVDGTLNMRGDKDKGWSLEVAIPWVNFEEIAKPPSGRHGLDRQSAPMGRNRTKSTPQYVVGPAAADVQSTCSGTIRATCLRKVAPVRYHS